MQRAFQEHSSGSPDTCNLEDIIPRTVYHEDPVPLNCRDNDEIEFYLDCGSGRDKNVRQYIRIHRPGRAVLEFVLEHAVLHHQQKIVDCLLEIKLGSPILSVEQCILRLFKQDRVQEFPLNHGAD